VVHDRVIATVNEISILETEWHYKYAISFMIFNSGAAQLSFKHASMP
jgi:hypothetical protein